jgi:hypothetical protein
VDGLIGVTKCNGLKQSWRLVGEGWQAQTYRNTHKHTNNNSSRQYNATLNNST